MPISTAMITFGDRPHLEGLTPKQQLFVLAWCDVDSETAFNATRSARRAGYRDRPTRKKTVRDNVLSTTGGENLRKPAIVSAIKAELAHAIERQGWNKDRIILELGVNLRLAREANQLSVANTALTKIAEIGGLIDVAGVPGIVRIVWDDDEPGDVIDLEATPVIEALEDGS